MGGRGSKSTSGKNAKLKPIKEKKGVTRAMGAEASAIRSIIDGEYKDRVKQYAPDHEDGYRSRYEGKMMFPYAGQLFIVDGDGRGGHSSDGKISTMFPDEVLFARVQIASKYLVKNQREGLTPVEKKNAKALYEGVKNTHDKLMDPADVRTSERLQMALGALFSKKGAKKK